MNEEALVSRLTRSWRGNSRVVVGVGDDCAVVRGERRGHVYLLKTDAVVEHRHFTPETPPRLIGRKALARVLSDIAAMGGVPLEALVTLGIPKAFDPHRLREVYAGLTALARRYEVNLVGGETTRTRDLMLSVSAWGECRGYAPVLRSGAAAGDRLMVTGRLGGSLAGKHLKFTPRLVEGQWLARSGLATAMMDLSDGLAGDLPRLLNSSKVGVEVDEERLPRTRGCSVRQACCDGEDYELLFTVRARDQQRIEQWPWRTPVRCIGLITPRSRQQPQAGLRKEWRGYDHLQDS